MNLSDSSFGSLRDAISQARSGDTIVFAPWLQGAITLTSGGLDISEDLQIEGPGANVITVSGDNASRVFDISSGVTVTLSGLTITCTQDHPAALPNYLKAGFAVYREAIKNQG
jgi:hypothetical protein